MKNFIQVQEEYAETVSLGMDRWSHRRDGGHLSRIRRGAARKARKAFLKFGFTDAQATQAIQDAHDVMMLERAAVDDDLNHAV